MSELKKFQPQHFAKRGGMTIAKFNDPAFAYHLSADEIQAARDEAISKSAFVDVVALLCERFDRTMGDALVGYNYQLVNEAMGPTELEAAFHDLMSAECAWHNTIPYLIDHVRRQREEGPDLIAKGMSEAYRRGSE